MYPATVVQCEDTCLTLVPVLTRRVHVRNWLAEFRFLSAGKKKPRRKNTNTNVHGEASEPYDTSVVGQAV